MIYRAIRGAVCAAIAAVLLGAAPSAVSRYGGPVYAGSPKAGVTAQFYRAGGEAGGFSCIRALDAIAGRTVVTAEFARLRGAYGDAAVGAFVTTFDYAMNDGWMRAGQKNVTFGAPATLDAGALGVALVAAGKAGDGTFWTGLFLDRILTHAVRLQVMKDIDARYGRDADARYHRIANRLFYDLAQALNTNAKLASFH